MPTPWMVPELVLIPEGFSILVMVGLLLAGIVEHRQGHIGRIGVALNAFLLWQVFYTRWAGLPEWFQWYLNVGTLFAIVAVASYLSGESLPSEFYSIAYL
jgi:hypothetical protein